MPLWLIIEANMIAYFDTSVLFRLYVASENFPMSILATFSDSNTVLIHDYGIHELRNAIRLAAFRGDINHDVMRTCLGSFEDDLYQNVYILHRPHPDVLLGYADELSEKLTPEMGLRWADLWHLAVAYAGHTTDFYSADKKQLEWARKIGFQTHDISWK